jgi:hypothetical protein
VTLRDSQQCLRRTARLAAALFPLLEGAPGNSEERGKLFLSEPCSQAGANDPGTLDGGAFAAAPLDLANAVQNLLPDIALRAFRPSSFFECLSLRRARSLRGAGFILLRTSVR